MDLTQKRNGFLRTSIRNIDEEKLQITHTVNTKALDRYDTVVLPKGADVKHFLNNAVVLWSHNMDSATPKIPIGRCIDLDIREDEIVTTTEFNQNDPLAVKVFNAYKDGFLHAWSIGFIPLSYKKFDEENMEDLNKKYNLSITKEQIDSAPYGVYLIYKWELLEYSAVPVPGNPEALSADGAEQYKRELVQRGLVEENIMKDVDIRKVLDKKVEKEGEAEVVVEETPTEDVVEETPAEEVVEETPESEEVVAEAEEAVEDEVNDEVENEVVEEEAVEESEVVEESSESTEDNVEEPESVAEVDDQEEQDTLDEEEAPDERIVELTQKNQELSDRVAQLEASVKELSKINSTLDEIKQSLDVDNLDKVRDAATKRKSDNPEAWFSNFLRNS